MGATFYQMCSVTCCYPCRYSYPSRAYTIRQRWRDRRWRGLLPTSSVNRYSISSQSWHTILHYCAWETILCCL